MVLSRAGEETDSENIVAALLLDGEHLAGLQPFCARNYYIS
jgi:hypothetical protein